MLNREMSPTNALAYVKQRGSFANPYFGFMNKLADWQVEAEVGPLKRISLLMVMYDPWTKEIHVLLGWPISLVKTSRWLGIGMFRGTVRTESMGGFNNEMGHPVHKHDVYLSLFHRLVYILVWTLPSGTSTIIISKYNTIISKFNFWARYFDDWVCIWNNPLLRLAS